MWCSCWFVTEKHRFFCFVFLAKRNVGQQQQQQQRQRQKETGGEALEDAARTPGRGVQQELFRLQPARPNLCQHHHRLFYLHLLLGQAVRRLFDKFPEFYRVSPDFRSTKTIRRGFRFALKAMNSSL